MKRAFGDEADAIGSAYQNAKALSNEIEWNLAKFFNPATIGCVRVKNSLVQEADEATQQSSITSSHFQNARRHSTYPVIATLHPDYTCCERTGFIGEEGVHAAEVFDSVQATYQNAPAGHHVCPARQIDTENRR